MTQKKKIKEFSQKLLLKWYGELVVKIENDFGLVVALDRCRRFGGGEVLYNLFINGVSHQFRSIRDACNFLSGFHVGFAYVEKDVSSVDDEG